MLLTFGHTLYIGLVLFSIQYGQIYTRGAVFCPHPNVNPISTNTNGSY